MAKKKISFTKTYRSLTEIGEAFNLSARKVGSELKRLGFRDEDGRPTNETLESGMAVLTPMKNKQEHFRWNIKEVQMILEQHHKRDNSAKQRKLLKSMVSIMKSDEWEYGGGIGYKMAIEEFFDDVKSLIKLGDVDHTLTLIDELKVKQSDKTYFKEVIYNHFAESSKITKEQVDTIFELKHWSILNTLSRNKAVDELTRQRAAKLSEELRKELIHE